MKLQCPFNNILLPIDGSEHSKRAVKFAGYLGASLGKSLSGITLLNVTGGSYLSPATSIDLREKALEKPETLEMIRDAYIKDQLVPILVEGEKILREAGVDIEIGRLLVDGDPASEIINIADKEKFSTIIMARRGLSKIKEFFLGSVTNKVVHTAIKQTVYIVGQQVIQDTACPVSKILIPVDGSPYSLKGVEHAACLAYALKDSIEKITLLQVIDSGLEEEANKVLDETKASLIHVGIPGGLVKTKVISGTPTDEILKEAEEDYNLIIIGRKGRTALKDLVLGSVSSTVIHHSYNPTVAIMSSD